MKIEMKTHRILNDITKLEDINNHLMIAMRLATQLYSFEVSQGLITHIENVMQSVDIAYELLLDQTKATK